MASKQIDSKKVGWGRNFVALFPNFEAFKNWYDPIYKGESAAEVWKKIGGKLPEKQKAAK